MKKKGTVLLLAGLLLLNLCACGEKETQAVPTPSTEPTATVTPTPTPAPTLPTTGPSEDGELFRAFLDGEVAAVAGDDFYNSLQYIGYNTMAFRDDFEDYAWMGTETMSVQGLTELVKSSVSTEGTEDLPDTTVDYAVLKTMGGRQMLVMRYDTPAGIDEFWSYFVFGNYDGQLRLTFAEDSWSRSRTEPHEGLIFSGDGSGGAGDYFTWCGYIGEDGHYQIVYDGELLSGPWVAMNAYEVFGFDDDYWAVNCQSYLLTTAEGKFYDLDGMEGTDLTDTDPEKLARLRQYYAEQGYTEVDDAEAVIAAALSAHGVDPDAPVIEDWTPLEELDEQIRARTAYEQFLAGDMSLLEPVEPGWAEHVALIFKMKLEYTYLDLDGDGVEELLLQCVDDPQSYNGVFHYAEGQLRCWQHDTEEMACRDYPLRDGTMVRQYETAWISYTLFRYQKDGSEEKIVSLAAYRKTPDAEDYALYEIDGEKVSMEEFQRQVKRLVTDQLLEREAWTRIKDWTPLDV